MERNFFPSVCIHTSAQVCCSCCLVAKSCGTLFRPHRLACLSMGFPREEYWSGLPFPFPGGLPYPGIEPASPALARRFCTTEPQESHRTLEPVLATRLFLNPELKLVTSFPSECSFCDQMERDWLEFVWNGKSRQEPLVSFSGRRPKWSVEPLFNLLEGRIAHLERLCG